jgi:hypothetical protein
MYNESLGCFVLLMRQFALLEESPLTTLILQRESQVSLNTVDSIDTLVTDVKNGHWDAVLNHIATLKLSFPVVVALYEQVRLLTSPPQFYACA